MSAMVTRARTRSRRGSEVALQLAIEVQQRNRGAGHLHRRRITADQRLDDRRAGIGQAGMDPAVHDQQLFHRRGAEAVDQHRDPRAAGDRTSGQQVVHHRVGDRVGRLQRPAMHPRLAVDAHADLHLALANRERRLANLRHRAGRHRHADRPAGVGRPLRHLGDTVEVQPGFSRSTGDLERIDHPGDAAPLLPVLLVSTGDVVRQQDGRTRDVLHLDEVAGHVEVHHVAAVVAIQAQHTGTRIRLPHRDRHVLGRRRREHVANRAGIKEARADVTGEHRQMARATARDDADLAGLARRGTHDHPVAVLGETIVLRKRKAQALQRLLCICEWENSSIFFIACFL